MVNPASRKYLLAAFAAAFVFAVLAVLGAFGEDRETEDRIIHNRQGLEYFNKGFYDHAAHKQMSEAEKNYRLAVKEFNAAISKDPSYSEAHRNLARVYFVQKNFQGAAEEYKRVTELNQADLDAYVNLALALIELKKPAEAIQTLEKAKDQTSDPEALKTLNIYISKVKAYEATEGR